MTLLSNHQVDKSPSVHTYMASNQVPEGSSGGNTSRAMKYRNYLEEMELKIRYMKNDIEFKKSQLKKSQGTELSKAKSTLLPEQRILAAPLHRNPTAQQRTVQNPQQRIMQNPHRKIVQNPLQRTVTIPEQRTVHNPQQINVQNPHHRTVQNPHHRTVQTPQQRTVQIPQERRIVQVPEQMINPVFNQNTKWTNSSNQSSQKTCNRIQHQNLTFTTYLPVTQNMPSQTSHMSSLHDDLRTVVITKPSTCGSSDIRTVLPPSKKTVELDTTSMSKTADICLKSVNIVSASKIKCTSSKALDTLSKSTSLKTVESVSKSNISSKTFDPETKTNTSSKTLVTMPNTSKTTSSSMDLDKEEMELKIRYMKNDIEFKQMQLEKSKTSKSLSLQPVSQAPGLDISKVQGNRQVTSIKNKFKLVKHAEGTGMPVKRDVRIQRIFQEHGIKRTPLKVQTAAKVSNKYKFKRLSPTSKVKTASQLFSHKKVNRALLKLDRRSANVDMSSLGSLDQKHGRDSLGNRPVRKTPLKLNTASKVVSKYKLLRLSPKSEPKIFNFSKNNKPSFKIDRRPRKRRASSTSSSKSNVVSDKFQFKKRRMSSIYRASGVQACLYGSNIAEQFSPRFSGSAGGRAVRMTVNKVGQKNKKFKGKYVWKKTLEDSSKSEFYFIFCWEFNQLLVKCRSGIDYSQHMAFCCIHIPELIFTCCSAACHYIAFYSKTLKVKYLKAITPTSTCLVFF